MQCSITGNFGSACKFAQLGKWEWLAVDGEWAVGAHETDLATTWHYKKLRDHCDSTGYWRSFGRPARL